MGRSSCLGDFQGPRWRGPGPAALVVGEPPTHQWRVWATKDPSTPGSGGLELNSTFLSPSLHQILPELFPGSEPHLSIYRMDVTRTGQDVSEHDSCYLGLWELGTNRPTAHPVREGHFVVCPAKRNWVLAEGGISQALWPERRKRGIAVRGRGRTFQPQFTLAGRALKEGSLAHWPGGGGVVSSLDTGTEWSGHLPVCTPRCPPSRAHSDGPQNPPRSPIQGQDCESSLPLGPGSDSCPPSLSPRLCLPTYPPHFGLPG